MRRDAARAAASAGRVARPARLADCPVNLPPDRHAYAVGIGREGRTALQRLPAGGATLRHVEEGRPVRDASGNAVADAGDAVEQAAAVATALLADACPREAPHVVVVGPADDPFAAAFFRALAHTLRNAEPAATLASLWVLPGADERPKTCYHAARFVATMAEEDGEWGVWSLVAPESLAAARGIGPSDEPLAGDAYLAALVSGLASPAFGAALRREAEEARVRGHVLASVVGASLVVCREEGPRGETTLANVARLAAANALLDADAARAVSVSALVRLSQHEHALRDHRDVERQVANAVADVSPHALATVTVIEGVLTHNRHLASAILAFAGVPIGEPLAPILASAARWGAAGAEGQAVAAARKAIAAYDERCRTMLRGD